MPRPLWVVWRDRVLLVWGRACRLAALPIAAAAAEVQKTNLWQDGRGRGWWRPFGYVGGLPCVHAVQAVHRIIDTGWRLIQRPPAWLCYLRYSSLACCNGLEGAVWRRLVTLSE